MNTSISTVTSKGQVTIPAPFRKKCNINKGDMLLFNATNEGITIKKVEPLDTAYLASLESTLAEEWNSEEDNKAYHDL